MALARAIVNEPEVLLLDEPLAALDLKLRERMLVELIDFKDTLKTTFIYVTHDQSEALTMADYMAIMNHDGEIEQVGTPKEIYEFPILHLLPSLLVPPIFFKGYCNMKSDRRTVMKLQFLILVPSRFIFQRKSRGLQKVLILSV